ncbi:tRNA (adenosine(37)-N6)-dimethylallyltransferase MiaA [Pedobacter sp. JCM 36344]|uniref:tRNA (adenosine(37)-N6)-dimethylallyltransferase MiaA n=1 Tax=Pedobacter sp. JCM 36344 TaxID=3374280 RepID=UPI00397940B6
MNRLIIILGPTASGKTRLAVKLACQLGAEIISADSRQVFRDMNIGTGKDLSEYIIDGHKIPFHLIDIKEAGEKYNVNEFKEDFFKVFNKLNSEGTLPILCGGTGMYIHSLLQNQVYTSIPNDEDLRIKICSLDIEKLRTKLASYPVEFTKHADLSSHKRLIRAIEVAEFLLNNDLPVVDTPIIRPLVIGLNPGLTLRRFNIIARLEARIQDGLIDEVEGLVAKGLSREMLDYYGLEYRFVGAYLRGEYSIAELKERLSTAICQFAKRQMTFFRKMEKDGVKINWFDLDLDDNELYDNTLQLAERSFLV